MKVSQTLSWLLATVSCGAASSSAATSSVVATSSESLRRDLSEANCNSLSFSYGSVTQTGWSSQKADGNFGIPEGGSVRCTLSCDSGSAALYIAFGSSGSPPGPGSSDGSDTGNSCNKVVQATNSGAPSVGFQYTVTSDKFENMQISCSCSDGDTPGLAGPAKGGGCFAASTTVRVEKKGRVSMRELRVGDKIYNSEQAAFETVYGFGHYDRTFKSEFLQIHTTRERQALELTANHFVYRKGEETPVRADELQVGDIIGQGKITQILTTTSRGIYMPLTPSGKVFVNDNIQASSYVSVSDYAPEIANHPWLEGWMSEDRLFHTWLSPARMICHGISSEFCHPSLSMANDHHDGVLPWLLVGKTIIDYLEELSLPGQVMFGIPIFLTIGTINAMEWFLFRPIMLFAGLVSLYLIRRFLRQCAPEDPRELLVGWRYEYEYDLK